MKISDNLETVCNEVIDACLHKVRNKKIKHNFVKLKTERFCINRVLNISGQQRQHEYHHHRFSLCSKGSFYKGRCHEFLKNSVF
jgi:hypothetical protein